MNNLSKAVAVSILVGICGCANHNDNVTTINAPPTPATDKKLIKTDNQAAELALSNDHQAVLPTSSPSTTTRAAIPNGTPIVSSLRIATAHLKPSRQASTEPANQNIDGTVTFTQIGSLLILVADLSGLQPNSTHALEIHDSADLSAPDLSSAGDCWNGSGTENNSIGLLGNVDADSTGRIYFERTLGGATVGGQNDIVGHSVVVFAQPAGKTDLADPRIAAGAIERHDQ